MLLFTATAICPSIHLSVQKAAGASTDTELGQATGVARLEVSADHTFCSILLGLFMVGTLDCVVVLFVVAFVRLIAAQAGLFICL